MVQTFYFEIHQAPSEITANLPCQFSLTVQIVLHWATATLKGLFEFQNKVLDHFLPLFLSKKCQFQDLRFQSTYKMRPSWCAPRSIDRWPSALYVAIAHNEPCVNSQLLKLEWGSILYREQCLPFLMALRAIVTMTVFLICMYLLIQVF